jgi:hypothetical protein
MGSRFLSLFVSPEEKKHRLKDILGSVQTLARKLREKFVFFIGLSLSIHLIVFGLLIMQGHSRALVPEARVQSNDWAISRAMVEIAKQARLRSPSGKTLAPEKMQAMANYFADLFRFDPKLTEKEKAEIFRELMEISSELGEKGDSTDLPDPRGMNNLIELLKQKKGLRLSSGDSIVITSSSPEGKYEIYKLDRSAKETLRRLEQEAKKGKPGAQSNNGLGAASAAKDPRSVPEEYYFRKSPYEWMMALGPSLFTVFRGFPALRTDHNESVPNDQAAARMTVDKSRLSPSLFVYFVSGRPPRGEKKEGSVLRLSDLELNRILDDLMTLKEPEQLDAFKKQYLDLYDLDQKDLAKLTREFLFSNMNNVFFVADRFSSAFDFIEEIYYKRAVCDLFASYANRFPRTRTGSEIMFYLASFFDFERRALEDLFRSQRDARAIIDGDREGPVIYQPTMKALVLNQIYVDIHQLAGERGLPLESLLDQYIRREEEIYQTLGELGGEIRNRALYAWGKLLWDEGNFDMALGKWKQVDSVFPLSSMAYWGSMGYIERFGLENSVKFVDERLTAESLKDQLTLLERHLKYHTWKKRTE